MYYNTKSLSAQQKVTGPDSFEARFSPEFRIFQASYKFLSLFPLFSKRKSPPEKPESLP